MYAIILAAGKGSRMKSELPKSLLPVAEKPMIDHVVDAAMSVVDKQSDICIVHGHLGNKIKSHFRKDDFLWAQQTVQNGTGEAVRIALDKYSSDEDTLILYGDVPLISNKTLLNIRSVFVKGQAALTILTAIVEDPHGYGRIVRNKDGNVTDIVEEKDATENQKKITEINTGIMMADGRCLRQWVNSLGNNNNQKEYYLTDIVSMASSQGYFINSCKVDDIRETLGANDPEQLMTLEHYYKQINK
jgi:bifunctional UDP-N-acetylglucosamine pyrophosphorylase/glucosamine-1-phosphate N-acetyltransferase